MSFRNTLMINLRMYNRIVEGALELKRVLNGGERVGRVGYLFCELDVFRAIWDSELRG